jgi:formate hydrogenlyase subunit 3/multisubunit Na+/H+ antiporter MnhD subunit
MKSIFDFISQYAERIGSEWFRLMEWLLIISALATAAKYSDNTIIKALPWLSVGFLWLYVFFSYSERFIKSLEPLQEKAPSLKPILIRGLIAIIISMFLFTLANQFAQIAVEFANHLVRAQ